MCLHNAVEVSSSTTYIKKFWTQVCGQFSKLTLHGTEGKKKKKKKKCDCIFSDSKEYGEKRQPRGVLKRKLSWFTLRVTKLLNDDYKL